MTTGTIAGRLRKLLAFGNIFVEAMRLGTFLRSFSWGHVRQLDRVGRELLARAWVAGAGPSDAPLTIDLDSTICKTYGLAKEGARHHGYTGQRGLSPGFVALTPVVAGRNALCQRLSSSGRATGRLAFGSH